MDNYISNILKMQGGDVEDAGNLIQCFQDGNVYKFTSNYIFTSPSGEAGVVLGRTANGWIEWKCQDGRTLDAGKHQNGES